jgi:GT2 family glycosyltransferase
MDLSIIVVNWHSRDHLQRCIASVLAYTRDIDFEIIVIDSASFDGCDHMVAAHYPDVHFVQSATNCGFAKANNHAFRKSIGNCVLFLNPDTELLGPAINILYSNLNSLPDCGIVGARLLNKDGSLQSSCVQAMPTIFNTALDSDFLRAKWPKSSLWGMAPLFEAGGHARAVAAVSGACLMLKRSTFEQVAMFSEDYFMYADDVDLSHKVLAAGYQNYYVPQATVIHYGGTSSEQAASTFSAVMMREATWRFLRKTRGRAYGLGYRAGMFGSAVGRLVALAFALAFNRAKTPWKASFRKWLAILRWTLDRDDLVKQYYPR